MPLNIKKNNGVIGDQFSDLPTPNPVMGVDAYSHERELALGADIRRRINYENYLKARRDKDKLDYLPIKLDIENVSRCNFRCTMCQVSGWTKGKRAEDLPLQAFKDLLDEQYGVFEIKLQGMGEPLLQGDDYFEMIRYARERHIWVRTITNASRLHVKGNYRKLIDADPNEVQISIDGATKETFENIRQGSRFEKVKENCSLINQYCSSKGLARTKMWTVVQKENLHETTALVHLAKELGFTTMVLSLNLTDWGQQEWAVTNDAKTVEHSITEEHCWKLVEIGEELSVDVSFWRVVDKYKTGSSDTLCPWPFERAYVSSDQRVVPCCMLANPDISDLGSSKDFTATWEANAYREFRRSHLEGTLPAVCKGCYKN